MSFCPLIKEKCKGNQCVMWSDEACLVVNFLETFGPDQSEIEIERVPIEIEDIPIRIGSSRSADVPNWFKLATPEEIIEEYFDFLQKEFENVSSHNYQVFELFLQQKGLTNTWMLPQDMGLKMQKARTLLSVEIQKRREAEKQERLEHELIQAPSLAEKFLNWMDDHGIDKVYKKNISRFLQEERLDLLRETQSSIFDFANKGYDDRIRIRIEEETRELPSLIDQSIDWATHKGFKSITKSDLDAFLIENKISITNETKKTLYSMANTQLKSKR